MMNMIRILTASTCCCTALILYSQAAGAGSLKASPISLSVAAPGETATLTISSPGDSITAGQVRVVRWTQSNGKELLIPTREVVASPPALRLRPGRNMTIRLVRTAKTAVNDEECYRVLVDQLPGPEQDKIAVKFAIRHSIPLCFDATPQSQGAIEWSVRKQGGKFILVGTNDGATRIVAKNIVITGADGAKMKLASAVVLGVSTMSWPLAGKIKNLGMGSSFTLSAEIYGKDVVHTGKVSGK